MNTSELVGLRRASALLAILSNRPDGMTFGQLQSGMGNLAAPTLSRLLKVLVAEGWLEKGAENRYLAGVGFRQLCLRICGLASDTEIMASFVHELAAVCWETAGYAVFAGDGFMFKAKDERPSSYHHIECMVRNGDVISNGYGRMSLAYQTESVMISNWIRHGISESEQTRLLDESRQIRERGWLVSREPIGTRFLAAVFLGESGAFSGVLGVSSIMRSIPEERNEFLLGQVCDAARSATRRLGFQRMESNTNKITD